MPAEAIVQRTAEIRAKDHGWGSKIDDRFPDYSDLMRRYVLVHRDRCRQLSGRSRRWFRGTGVVVIAFSVTLPLLTSVNFVGKSAVISILALTIAGLSSLRGFFSWDQNWRLYQQQDVALTALIARWETEMTALLAASSDNDERAQRITHDILLEAYEHGRAEFDGFFATIAWPQRSG